MRNWIEIIEQLDLFEDRTPIPESDYGYWIDPNGRFIPVTKNGPIHKQVYQDEIGDKSASLNMAFRDGWVRVICYNVNNRKRLIIEQTRGFFSARAISALTRLARETDPASFEAEVGDEFARKDDLKSFLAFIRQHQQVRDEVALAAEDDRRNAALRDMGLIK